jgi:acetyl esterase/lipase
MWHLTWVCSDSIRTSRVAFFAILICLIGCMVPAVTIAIDPTQKDVRYATVDGQPLRLDFYAPEMQIPERPLIIWVHGGAWRSGTKANVPLVSLRKRGFAIASIEYRLSPVAKFPAQIHDIKAAVRYLRSQAERFDVAPDKFILAGSSAGGHLAVLAAVTEGIAELDPPDNIKIESAGPRPSREQVQAVVSFFGAGNLQTILSQSTPFGLEVRVPALKLLLGGLPDEVPALARLASPVLHVDSRDPPLWLFHGDQDPQMPINQSHELVGAYNRHAVQVKFEVVHGGAHGGEGFFTDPQLNRLADDLLVTLRNNSKQAASDVQFRPSSNPTVNLEKQSSGENKAKTHNLSRAEFAQLPDIRSFRDQPTNQFIIPWESYRTGHPYLGRDSAKPHTGGHVYFQKPSENAMPSDPFSYPAIYAFADGVVTRIDEAFRLRPVYFPSLGTTRANLRYGIDITFAKSGDQPVSFHYSIEPMVDPGSLDFYQRFLHVRIGQHVKKGDTIAHMYIPHERSDAENSHIHFNLIRGRQFQAPSIFTTSVSEQFAASWDSRRLDGDWPIPPTMGWKLHREEDPFGTE